MIQNNNSYTIASLSEDINKSIRYRIPIYQRLFVWDEKQINQLLDDLYKASVKAKDTPYYIGIITIVKREDAKVWEIVDGQQRLTFLTLFAALAEGETPKFDDFLFNNDKELRMEYVGREHDTTDIEYIVENKFDEIKNMKTRKFVNAFNSFIENINKKSEFFAFVRAQATFLCSELDPNYTPHELNRHFERINATGRQLEPQDIIKGKYFQEHAVKFNKIIDFSKKYSQDNISENNNQCTDKKSFIDILKCDDENIMYSEPTEKSPKSTTRAIVSESTFILHALRIYTDFLFKGDKVSLDQYKLIEIFKKNIDNRCFFGEYFISKMKKYRKWLDGNIIYITENGFNLKSQDNSEESEYEDINKRKLLQYQSMLGVSSFASQEWVLKAYEKSEGGDLTLEHLKEIDNRPLPILVDMCYGKIERYWFWKLDYLLWEICVDKKWSSGKEPIKVNIARHEFKFNKDEFKAIKNYSFKENRSIEHLHPQSSGSFGDQVHFFGNLAMISASFNSAQGNDAINTKFGRLQDRLKNEQSLESIKLLLMFKLSEENNNVWNENLAKQHGEAMHQLLASSHRQ